MNQHVLVSGASRGLGAAIVESLLGNGYHVSGFSRTSTDFTDSLSRRADAFYANADLSDEASLKRFVHDAAARFGPPYALVNCGAVAADGLLATLMPQDIRSMAAVNYVGTLLLTREVVRQMIAGGDEGAIVNVSSIAGSRGFSGLSAYGATKAALDGATRALARELGPRNIRVNSVAPGFVATEMTRSLGQTERDAIVRRTPLGRLAEPADVAGVVLFLLTKEASFISGQVIAVDGGLTA
jgi:3-oxoacyl-[acyl-carrier protein] reductase